MPKNGKRKLLKQAHCRFARGSVCVLLLLNFSISYYYVRVRWCTVRPLATTVNLCCCSCQNIGRREYPWPEAISSTLLGGGGAPAPGCAGEKIYTSCDRDDMTQGTTAYRNIIMTSGSTCAALLHACPTAPPLTQYRYQPSVNTAVIFG